MDKILMKVQVEFAVKSNEPEQTESLIKKALSCFPVSFNLKGNDSLVVQSQDQSPSLMLKSLRANGLVAIIRGLSSAATRASSPYTPAASGVCIFEAFAGSKGWAQTSNKGVARLAQLYNEVFIDLNASDLLPLTKYSVEIRECGDLSDPVRSTGDVYQKISNTSSDATGTLELVTEIKNTQMSDLIGRSLVLCPQNQENNQENHYVAGIIARSAGVFENQKMVCACSGKTLWDEASKL
jgi:copper chaperone for superoxide dismutase